MPGVHAAVLRKCVIFSDNVGHMIRSSPTNKGKSHGWDLVVAQHKRIDELCGKW